MYWTAIAIAFGSFFIFLGIQIFLGHLVKPKSEDKFIFGLFVFLPMATFLVLFSLNFCGTIGIKTASLAFILFFVISSSWVASYPALYASCPTLIISLLVSKTKSGVTLEELCNAMSLKENSIDRIEDAVQDRLIKKNGDHLEMTPLGKFLFVFFKTYRRVLSLKSDTI